MRLYSRAQGRVPPNSPQPIYLAESNDCVLSDPVVSVFHPRHGRDLSDNPASSPIHDPGVFRIHRHRNYSCMRVSVQPWGYQRRNLSLRPSHLALRLYGVTLLQTYIYYTRFRGDPVLVKSVVGTRVSMSVRSFSLIFEIGRVIVVSDNLRSIAISLVFNAYNFVASLTQSPLLFGRRLYTATLYSILESLSKLFLHFRREYIHTFCQDVWAILLTLRTSTLCVSNLYHRITHIPTELIRIPGGESHQRE